MALWEFHRPITMGGGDAPELAPLGMFLEVLKACCWHVETGDMNLAEDIFAQLEGCCHSQVHLDEAGVDKGFIVNKFHRGRHIHLLHDGTIESMFTDTLQALWKIDLLQSPTTHEGSIGNLGDTIWKNDGGQLLACAECVRSNRRGLSRNDKLPSLCQEGKNQCLTIF